jgi:CheY-like chemotaxis protein
VIQQAVEVARPLVDQAGHKLIIELPDEPIYLNADRTRLAQVFGNLLNNSNKYTPKGGVITVTVARRGNEAEISVADTGSGIPPDKLDSIFDMFMQIDRTVERSQGGLGIGLTLVKRLVQMHGGSIEAKSAGRGQGSEFIVRLPVMIESQGAPADATTASPEPAHAYRVLVVDDNQDAASSLALLLQIAGHQTFRAHDGPTALEAAAQHRPDIVLLDIGLPTLNGYEVCRRIREQPWGRDMLLIALTGWGQDEDRRKSHDAGFDGHLVKPVDYAALTTLLDSMVTTTKAR